MVSQDIEVSREVQTEPRDGATTDFFAEDSELPEPVRCEHRNDETDDALVRFERGK